jgi:hypothetical protein
MKERVSERERGERVRGMLGIDRGRDVRLKLGDLCSLEAAEKCTYRGLS